jgi:Acetyltransferase (GNAT) domain
MVGTLVNMSIRNHLIKMIENLRSRFRGQRLRLWQLSGRERYSACPLQIAYAGHAAGMHYVSEMAFGDGTIAARSSRIWSWNALNFRCHRYKNSDLAIAETRGEPANRNRYAAEFYVPGWFEAVIDLSNFEKQLLQSKNVKNDLRKIRKYGLKYRISRDPMDFDDFYHRMYLPHITKAHQSQALPMSYSQMVSHFDESELLLVTREGEDIAGSILLYIDGQAHTWKLGVSRGDRKLISEGALSAVYYFQLEHLKNLGYRKILCGGTRALVNDGGYQHKRKWGMTLDRAWQDGLLISVRKQNDGVKAFLQNNPFIHVRNGKHRCAIFSEPDEQSREAAVAKFYSNYSIAGIEWLDIYNADDATLVSTTELAAAT